MTETATKVSANVAEFKIKSSVNFIAFLKRFTSIEKGLLLEVHQDSIKAKSHTEDRSVVKYSKMPIVDVLEGDMEPDVIKVGIYDLKKVTKVFDHFSDGDEIFMHIKYENVSGEYVASQLLFKGPSLKIKILCADSATFNYISPEMMKKLIGSVDDDKIVDFPFPKEAFAKANSLCSIDTGKDFLSLNVEDSKIQLQGKSFDYTVGDAPGGVNTEFTFYNEHFGLIEQEISTFVIAHTRMLVKSQESDTVIIIGRIE